MVLALASVGATRISGQTTTTTAPAPPKVFYACYVPLAGTVYRIKEPGLLDNCAGPTSGAFMNIQFNWTDGINALHSGDAAGGDLAGMFPNPSLAKLLGFALTGTPANGQVLAFNGTSWTPAPVKDGAALHTGDAAGGDLAGTYPNPNVAKLRGIGLSTTAPATGQVLTFDGTNWGAATPGKDATALHTGDAAGGDLSGTFPNPNVAKLQGAPVTATGASGGQVLTFNGTSWAPATPVAASGTSSNTPNTLVQRDGSGGFAAGALTVAGKIDQTSNDGFVSRGTLGSGGIPAVGSGARFMWYPAKAALRAGSALFAEWDDANVGVGSIALGSGDPGNFLFGPQATGTNSVAIGQQTFASGTNSVAIGPGSSATGISAFALAGGVAPGSGAFSVRGTASGINSIALAGTASGTNSIAIGGTASTNGYTGAVAIADGTSGHVGAASADNQLVMKFRGGTSIYSSDDLTAGVSLAPGAGAWSTVSDVKRKQNFRDVDGDSVLAKIARMPIREWNYKSQPATIRHLGPTAQDFRAAFGLGESDTTITTVDIDGVNLLAVQALEKRTAELRAAIRDLTSLRAELAALRDEVAALRAERTDTTRPQASPSPTPNPPTRN